MHLIKDKSVPQESPKQKKSVKEYIGFTACFGVVIKDFCRKHLKLDLRRGDEDVNFVKIGFTQFFNHPRLEQQYMSSSMKSEIEQISGIQNVAEAVERLSQIYGCFCDLMNCDQVEHFLKNSDYFELMPLLKRAPVPQDCDDDLYDILCKYYKY